MPALLRDTKNGSFRASEHIEFVKNKRRNNAFKRAFERLARGKTVIDAGTGSGIMAIYAAKAGAKKVIAVEKDPVMAEIARLNIQRNGLENIVQLILGDASEVSANADIIVGELLSTWCVVEPQVPVFKKLLQLNPNAVTLPLRVENFIQGVNAQFGDEEGLVYIPTTYFEFDGKQKAEAVTERKLAGEIRFSGDMELEVKVRVSMRAIQDQVINALRLTSRTHTCEGVSFGCTDDTMPAMVTPLEREIRIKTGEIMDVDISMVFGKGWENFQARASIRRD